MMGMRCVIVGGSGGIGAALVRHLAARDDVEAIYATARDMGAVPDIGNVVAVPLDLGDEGSIAAAAERIAGDGPLDVVIVATGLLQREPDVAPEKSWRALDGDAMAEVFRINTIGPALVAKHFVPHLRGEGRPLFAAISARVGSIGDNRLGGWHSYRASKAALNQIMRNFAIELGRRNKGAVVVSLHPGTVETALSAPFSNNVPEGQMFTADHSAQCLLSVIDGLEAKDSGGFFAWDGQPIEF